MSVAPRSYPSVSFAPDLSRPLVVALSVQTAAVLVALGLLGAGIVIATQTALPEDPIGTIADVRKSFDLTAQYEQGRATVLLALASAALSTTPLLAALQWRGYEDLVPRMVRCGSLEFHRYENARASALEIAKANSFFRRVRQTHPVIFASCILIAAYVATSGTPVPMTTLSAWILGGSLAIQLHLITFQNLVGCRIILALWRIGKLGTFKIDILNRDRRWGWQSGRRILAMTYAEIVVHGVCLVALTLALPPDTIIRAVAALPAWQWIITLPIYILTPIILIMKATSLARSRFQDSIAHMYPTSSQHAIQLHQYAALVASIPRFPPFRPMGTAIFVLAQAANLITAYTLIKAS